MGKDLDDIFEDLIIDEFGDTSKNTNNEVAESIEDASDAKRQDTLINNEHINALKQDNEELEKQVSSFRKLSDVLKKIKDLHSSDNDTKESPIINSSVSSKSSSTITTGEQILNEMSKSKSGTIDSNRTQIFVDDFKQGIEESLKQAAENAISNILIDLSKNPEKIGLLQKGIIANIENGLKGPDERVRNFNSRKSRESFAERERYEDWLKKHQNSTQYSRDNNTVLSKNNENILTMRQLKTEFEVLFRNVKYDTKQNGLMTNEEGELYKKSKGFRDELNDSLDILEEKAKKISKLEDKLYNKENTSEEQEKIIRELNEVTADYDAKLAATITTYKKANETMTKGLESVRSGVDFIDDPEVLRKKKYNDAKYALFRTKSQTKDLQANGYIDAFSTTGYIGDSFRKTMFNRATGYRQQRGLVGLASNIGYNNSGVATSIALGGAAAALKKLGDVALNFTKQSLEAYGQIESIRTNLGIVYGSQSQANNTFEEIAQYATKSPFGVETVSQFAVQLKQSGVYASELMTVLKEIGDVAGGNQQKFGNIANAFAQIEANGKATTRQLREFATAGIPIYAQLSKQLGKSVEQIRQMTAQGQISSSIIEEAFAQLTGPNGMFNNAVNIGAKTFNARKQNLSDIWQLAKSEYGEVLVNGNFGVRSAQNESFGKSILSSLEDLGETVENIFKKMNIDRNLENVYLREDLLEKYQKELEKAEKKNNTEDIVKYSNLISELRNISTISEDRANKVNAYDYYNTELEKYKSLTPVQKIFDITKWNTSQKIDEIQTKLDSLKPSKNTSLVESYIQSGSDKLDKTTTRGNGVESLSKIPTSLYLLKQESDELWKQTVQGKKELEELKKADWDKMIELYNKLSPMIDNSGNLLKEELYNGKQLHDLLNSGIMSVVGTRNLNPESMSFNSESVKNLTGEAKKYKLEQVNSNYESLVNATLTLMQREVNDLSEQSIKGLKNFYESVIGQSVQYVENNGKKYFESTVNVSDLVGKVNNNNLITNVTNAFSDLLAILNKFNPEFAEDFNEYIGTERVKVDKPRNANDVLTQSADPYPLWQRIISNTLGVDLNLFKNTGNGKGWATNGNQALELYQKQMEKQTIKSVLSATMSSMGLKRALGIMGNSNNYGDLAGSVSNNSKDGTRQINWKETYKNVTDFAMAMESTAEVTRAYADSLSQSQSALEDFLSSSITQMEEPANIYDDNYQKVLGEYANNIKAVDANAFDMLFKEIEPGVFKMRENAINAAYSLHQLNENTLKAAEATAELKDKMKSLKDDTSNTLAYNRFLINNGNKQTLFSGMTKDSSTEIVKSMFEEVNKRVNDEKSPLYGLDSAELIQSYLDNKTVGRDNTVIDRLAEVRLSEKIDILTGSVSKLEEELNTTKKAYDDSIKVLQNAESNHVSGPELTRLRNKTYSNNLDYQLALDNYTKEKSTLDTIISNRDAIILANDEKEGNVNAKNSIGQLIDEVSKDLLDQYRAKESQKAIMDYQASVAPLTSLYNPLIEGQHTPGNTWGQQYVLNKMGAEGLWGDYRNRLVKNPDKTYNMDFVNSLTTQNENDPESLKTLKEQLQKMIEDGLNKDGSLKYSGGLSGMLDMKLFDKSFLDTLDQIIEKEQRMGEATNFAAAKMEELGKSMKSAMESFIADGITNTMKTLGSSMVTGADASEKLKDNWKEAAASLLGSIGSQMTMTGLQIAGAAAMSELWGLALAGLAMAGVGAAGSFAAGMLSEGNDKEKQREENLKNLRSLLQDIIEQAKIDAEYYEKNMRHNNALASNEAISTQSVNDAIIAPGGKVITTAPDDYLIATKTPGSLANKGEVVVNFQLIDQSSGASVQTKSVSQSKRPDGSIDIKAIVVAAVSEAVADGEMDGAFATREARLNGRQYL